MWALLWRSVVLLPLFFAFLVLLCSAYAALIGLPIAVVIYLWCFDWWMALIAVAAWFPTFIFLRWWWRRERSEDNWGVL